MRGRHTIWFPLALLALMALITIWIDRNVQAPQAKRDGNTRHDPDYKLNNFSTTKTDADGNLRYVLSATEMVHYPDDDSTQLQRPRFTQYTVGKPYTQIQGQRGLVSSKGDNVYIMDNVTVVRQAFEGRGEMRVLTEYLHVIPDDDLAITDRPVVITQAPKTVVYGTGMIYNKKARTLKLLSKVRAHYERPVESEQSTVSVNKKQARQKTPLAAGDASHAANTRTKHTAITKATTDKHGAAQAKSAVINKQRQPSPNRKQTRIRRHYEQTVSP
jgi:lipopolysaccharide export system protein LptC